MKTLYIPPHFKLHRCKQPCVYILSLTCGNMMVNGTYYASSC